MRSLRSLAYVTVLVSATPLYLAAQGVTAFKTGEETTGMTKQCYYSFGSNRYTKTVRSVELCPLSIEVALGGGSQPSAPSSRPAPLRPSETTAFKTGERITGMTKQCFYSFGGNEYTKTIQSVELCPPSIQVRL